MRKILALLMTALVVPACVGGAPEGDDDTDDTDQVTNDVADDTPTDDPGDDTPVEETRVLSGMTMDYIETDALANAALSAEGLDPAPTATSGVDGAFTFSPMPVGSAVVVTVTRTNYKATRNLPALIGDTDVVQNAYALSTPYITRQYIGATGQAPSLLNAFVLSELRKPDGTPLGEVPLAGITLVGVADNIPVPGINGPYAVGPGGDIIVTNPPQLTTTLADGKTRIVFLNVPPGDHAVRVTYDEGGTLMDVRGPFSAFADGATLSLVGGEIGGTPPPPPPTDPLFSTDIYPRLQKASAGGLGCANCHTATGTGAILPYDGLATDVLAAILARPGVVNLLAPADSLLLTKPLYEPTPPQNHPNATFLTVDDPDYKLFLLWITNGAKP